MAGDAGGARRGRREDGSYSPYGLATSSHDLEIAEEICNRLVRDERVEADQVDVQVVDGVVTLRGQVDSLAAKRAAGDDAWDTEGIVDVANLLAIPQ